jgi:hypothetical protein
MLVQLKLIGKLNAELIEELFLFRSRLCYAP